jgi:hypothetical protein
MWSTKYLVRSRKARANPIFELRAMLMKMIINELLVMDWLEQLLSLVTVVVHEKSRQTSNI